jgi:hypothetical protein
MTIINIFGLRRTMVICAENPFKKFPPSTIQPAAPFYIHTKSNFTLQIHKKGKAVPLQAWSGLEGSRKLRFPDYITTAQDGGQVVSLTHRPPLPSENAPGTHFCQRLSRPQGHSAIGRIMSMENFQ